MYKTKKLCAPVMILILIIVVSGCDKEKKIDYVENSNLASDTDGTKGEETEIGTETMSGSLAEQIGAPERWDGEYEGNDAGMTGIDVLTEVNLDGITGVNVYHAKSIKLTDTYKQNFVEALSEGIVYQYDEEMRPKDYWNSFITYQENEISSAEDEMSSNPEAYDDYYIDGLYATLREYQEKYEAAPDDYAIAEDYSGNEYKITYLGMDYCISFGCDDEGYLTSVDLEILDFGQLIGADSDTEKISIMWENANGFKYNTKDYEYQPDNNEYVREQSQIEQEAQTFLDRLGIHGFEMVRNCNINFYTGFYEKQESSRLDGCGMVLFKDMDGVYLCAEEYEPEISYFSDDETSYMESNRDRLEQITLEINDSGVFGMHYSFPMEWELQMENVQILSFDAIQDYMIQYARELDVSHPVFKSIEFVYCIYSEREGAHDFMVVPAWRFYSTQNESGYINEIMVNAIDGSRISIPEL
ncbi:MAG: hypothetical protein ACI39Q_03355 [Wujia sp.]